MAMVLKHQDMELKEEDRGVLRVLAVRASNPRHIRDETELPKGDLNTILNRLGRNGYVEQVTRGLYEITDKGREAIEAESREVDVAELERALDDIEAAAERGDGDALQSALEQARAAVNGQ